ncbi:MAG: response regulator transcription factor [Desulfobacterota bacterium]|nr:response regulator transcription factor [Thermodesulfobacteriota bacterium]
MKKTIALIEDEPDIVELISLHLTKAGYAVKAFLSGADFLAFLDKRTPELIILDLMLPDIDGLEICKLIRKRDVTAGIPIIMLTAKSEEMDKVLGLEIGADDYMTKPFSTKELIARVKALLRRHEPQRSLKKIEIGDMLTIDLGKYEVLVGGKRVELTPTEFKILELLSSKKGWVFSREQILDHLWGTEKAVIDRTVDVHIRHLREKIGEAAHLIKNIRGVGYKIEG